MKTKLDETIKHVEVAAIDATFAPSARARIVKFLESFVSFEPTLGLLYGEVPAGASGKGSWSITAFGQSTVDEMVAMYAGFGSVVCFDLDGLRVVIPQLGHIQEIESAVLDFAGDRLRPVPPKGS